MSTPLHKLPRARHHRGPDYIDGAFRVALRQTTDKGMAWEIFNIWMDADKLAQEQLTTWAKYLGVNGGSDPRHVWFTRAMSSEDAQESLKAPVPIPTPQRTAAERLQATASYLLEDAADLEEATQRFQAVVVSTSELWTELVSQIPCTMEAPPWAAYLERMRS